MGTVQSISTLAIALLLLPHSPASLPAPAQPQTQPPAQHHPAPSNPSPARHAPTTSPYPPNATHPPPAWMVDVAPQAGLRVMNVNGSPTAKRYIVEATGSGVAILDYDNDGWPDIFIVNGTWLHPPGPKSAEAGLAPTSRLFHNNHDGTFTDVTRLSGLEDIAWGQGACVGDYDNDGLDDIFVTGYGHNRLYHNLGHGKFREVAVSAGVAGDGKQWGTGCAFVDYDRDGKLDIAVATYVRFDLATVPKPGEGVGCNWKGVPVMCGPRGLDYGPNILYHNLGNGKFEDVTQSSGFTKTNGHYCFSVSTLDYDGDGWPDIFMACDSTPSILYHNNRDGTFTDVALEAGVAYNEDGREQAGMGSAIGDYDGDLLQDIFKTNFSDDTPTLYHAGPAHAGAPAAFTDVTAAAGLAHNMEDLGWGAVFADVDNDGWLDLIVANGHVYPQVDSQQLGSAFREPRRFYHNLGPADGAVKFEDLTSKSGPGLTTPASGRGLASADLWNDGRLEFVVNNLSDRPMLLVNEAKNSNRWLGVRLVGVISNRDGIGAQVTLHGHSRTWMQEVRSGSSYNSSSDLRLHFGLGQDTPASISVRWPSGLTETFGSPDTGSLPSDSYITLKEGSGKPATVATPVR